MPHPENNPNVVVHAGGKTREISYVATRPNCDEQRFSRQQKADLFFKNGTTEFVVAPDATIRLDDGRTLKDGDAVFVDRDLHGQRSAATELCNVGALLQLGRERLAVVNSTGRYRVHARMLAGTKAMSVCTRLGVLLPGQTITAEHMSIPASPAGKSPRKGDKLIAGTDYDPGHERFQSLIDAGKVTDLGPAFGFRFDDVDDSDTWQPQPEPETPETSQGAAPAAPPAPKLTKAQLARAGKAG